MTPDPVGRDRFAWDLDVKGFGLKVASSGSKTYVLQYRTAEGRGRRYSIGKHGSPWTCDEARAKAVSLLRDLSAGTDPLEAKAAARIVVTVADLAALYVDEGPAEKPNKKATSWEADRSNIERHIKPLLGSKPIKQLASAELARFQADVAAGRSAADEKTKTRGRAIVRGGKASAARTLAVLKAMLEFGVRRRLLTTNPAKGVVLYKIESRERFLLDREVIALADALAVMEEERAISGTMAGAIRLLLLIGARKQEIAALQWAWVDLDRSCLRLLDSKTGAKVVPIAAAALALLASRERTSPYVFPSSRSGGPIVGLQRAWDTVRKRATVLARQRAIEAGELADRATG